MSKDAAALQEKYQNCQLSMGREKSFVFIAESVTNQVLQYLYKKKNLKIKKINKKQTNKQVLQ